MFLGKISALLFLTLVGLAQAQLEHLRADAPQDELLEFEAEFDSPDNKLDLIKFFAGRYYQNTYRKINEYLVTHLDDPNPESNLQLALDWLNNKKERPGLFDREVIDALTQFTALSKTEHRCDKVSYVILVKNDRATNHVVRTPHIPRELRRIESIVRHYAFKHAKECLENLPERLKKKMETLDQIIIKRVEDFFNTLVTKNKIGVYLLMSHLLRDSPDIKYLGKVSNEKSGKLEINKTKLAQLLEQHLADIRGPCRYYVDELGPNEFIPALYDYKMFPYEARLTVTKTAYAMSRYELCKLVLKTPEDLLSRLLEGIKARSH